MASVPRVRALSNMPGVAKLFRRLVIRFGLRQGLVGALLAVFVRGIATLGGGPALVADPAAVLVCAFLTHIDSLADDGTQVTKLLGPGAGVNGTASDAVFGTCGRLEPLSAMRVT